MSEADMKAEHADSIPAADGIKKAADRLKELRDKPAESNGGISRRTFLKWGLGLGVAGTVAALENKYRFFLPDSTPISPEIPSTFDNNADINYVVAGEKGNAVPTTPQEIKDFLASTPPVFVKPESGGHAPSIKVIFPVNPEKAESVKIVKTVIDTRRPSSRPEDYYYYAEHSQIYLSGDAPFNLPLIEGAKTVEAKVEANKNGILDIVLVYLLNDGQTVNGYLIFWDKNYIPTDILNRIPPYDPDVSKTTEERNAIQGKEFDLKQNPSIPLFHASGTTHVSLMLGKDQFALAPAYKTENGKIQY